MTTNERPTKDRRSRERGGVGGFTWNDLMLLAVVLFSLTVVGLGTVSYVLPAEHLEIAELQPASRVATLAEFPVGASRLVTWGELIILVVRTGESTFSALEGVSPKDGCIMDWNAESRRITSPCNHLIYDLNGNVVTGLTTTPLRRYSVFVRAATVYVTS